MCDNNCVLRFNPDVQGKGNVATLQDNADSQLVTTGNTQDPTTWTTFNGFLGGNVPITITEQGPNSGIFGSYDESDTSVIKITDAAKRGTSASIDYNETPVTILVGFNFATIDIKPIDAEWSSGEEIPLSLVDGDANKNSRADEDLDLFNPGVSIIPTLTTGKPVTLHNLAGPTLTGGTVTLNEPVQKFSERAMLKTGSATTTVLAHLSGAVGGTTLTLPLGTMDDLFKSTPINKANFHGFILLNYDVRSLTNTPGSGINTVDITLAGVSDNSVPANPFITTNTFLGQPLQGLILLNEGAFENLAAGTPLTVTFTANGIAGALPGNTVFPVAADIFGYGFLNDGRETNERIANQIIRLELEETGDNTSTFDGTLEYTMINQLNILDPATYTGLTPISRSSKLYCN